MKTLLLLRLLALGLMGCNWQPTDHKICVEGIQYRIWRDQSGFWDWRDQSGFWEEGKDLRIDRDFRGKPIPCAEQRP